MKFYKLDGEVYAFEADGSQENFITADMVLMTADEIDRHINPQDYLTDDRKHEVYLKSLKPLTRRQFKLALLDADLTTTIETAIASIEDKQLRAVLEIEYSEATEFVRTSDSVITMGGLLGLTDDQINDIWERALKL